LLPAVYSQALQSGPTRRNLIDAWLLGFSPNAPMIEEAGIAIRRLLAASADARLDLWRAADRRVELFDARYGPRRTAEWLVNGPETLTEVLRPTGLDDPQRSVGGYARAVQDEVLALVPAALRSDASDVALGRILAFLAPDQALRFPEPQARGEVARGLLSAWLSDGQEPDSALRDSVRNFLLKHVRDPRTHGENWKSAGKDAIALMRRWLARASFKAFFDLISEHASDRQWRYREAFWSAYLERGIVDDVWLALGSQIHASARAVRELNGAYARLEGTGGTHSILLIEVGDVVLCEWSNVGKLRAWPKEWKNTPRLGLQRYSRNDVMGKGLPFPPSRPERPRWPPVNAKGAPDGNGLSHVQPEHGYWQSSAAEFLARRTGIHLTAADWLPR
jgi:hypothetical protein